MKHRFCLSILLSFSVFLSAQEISVTGTVYDQISNEPLPGVNVFIKGTTNGTSTDFDGNFALNNANIGDVLVFSYISFVTQEITVTNQDALSVYLSEDVAALDEVVVIGYGTQRKKEVTGAVSVIGSEAIEELNPTQIEQALQGQVAGVNISSTSGAPGSGLTINIRGISSNNVDESGKPTSRPLILVDGNVIEDLSVINPSDIENINILKDATAGIYGVRAANGVILITTKTGRKNTGLRFNYDAWGGFQQTSRTIPVLNATEYALLTNEAFAAGGQAPPFLNIGNLGNGTDWQAEVFQNAPIFNHNITINGGSKRSTYSFGAGLLTQDGIVGGSKANFNRSTIRMNVNTDILDNLKLTTNLLYTNTGRKELNENNVGSVLFNALNNAPTFAIRDSNGDFTLAEGLGNEVINPLAQIENTFKSTDVDRISGKIGANLTFLKNFSLESNFQFNYSEVQGKTFTPIAFYGDGKVFNNIGRNEEGVRTSRLDTNKDIFRDYTFDNFINYNTILNDAHTINAIVGMSIFDTSGQFSGTYFGFFPETEDKNFNNARIEDLDVVNNDRIAEGQSGKYRTRLLSYFARLQYNYKGRYLFSGVLRRDGSTAFGPNNRFGYFPSGSLGWVISDEPFFTENKAIDFLKFRASYGIIGNDRIRPNSFRSILDGEGVYVIDGERRFGAASGVLANPEIKWEEQETLDIGLDMRLFNSTINVTADYFNRRTQNLLVQPPVSGILGATAPGAEPPPVNAGTIENRGFEFAIGYQNGRERKFTYNINYNATFLENEVISVNNGVGFLPGGSFGIGQLEPSRMEAGKPIGYFFGLETDGIFQNQNEVDSHAAQTNAAPGDLRFVDQNGDGVIDSDDRTDIGNPIPDVTMGLSFNARFGNFDFNANTFASLGNEIVRNYERDQPLVNRSVYALNRWTGEGSTNQYPRVTTAANSNMLFSDFFVEDGSFLRIQNIQLGYTLPSSIMERFGANSLRFYVSANNVYTFTEYKGYDPSATSGAPIGGGIDQGFYPVPRTYLLGLNLKF